MKTKIDWIPLADGAVRPTRGKTLAVMQISGGSRSFNAVNPLRVLCRWRRMLTIPNQSSVAKAFSEFDDTARMKPSNYYDRVVDAMEELVKFTLLTRGASPYLTDRSASAVKAPKPCRSGSTSAACKTLFLLMINDFIAYRDWVCCSCLNSKLAKAPVWACHATATCLT